MEYIEIDTEGKDKIVIVVNKDSDWSSYEIAEDTILVLIEAHED